ncbi:urease subunit beta [Rhodalgimonas zhirmunskyi]|uniref:urease n=1 Tax=Rhodalgimonas zhirmunskyi TaxID=2964767 RepID=A0AAJ1U980_9RHOB|nr:urease subunit beta [Rhodoalgimonas zhirmunskyi]MDQ2093588.1 urease subunit beta [Rhodoalgimonas zhirmunskyi]
MHLTPTELERLTIFSAAQLARRYLQEGVRLSHPEAVAYLADEILLAARKGLEHPDLVAHAATLLTHEQVEPGVPTLLDTFSVEVMMDQGTKLVTVFDPIEPGPFEPVPGEVIAMEGEIELNAGREQVEISVLNTGDRSVQVRSHAHFFEVNKALSFDRKAAYGMRLDRPSGGGERFDPGIEKRVVLVPFGGKQVVHGFAGLTEGQVETQRNAAFIAAAKKGYL